MFPKVSQSWEIDSNKKLFSFPFREFVMGFVSIVDLVDSRLFEHHLRVGYLAYRLGEVMDFSEEEKKGSPSCWSLS